MNQQHPLHNVERLSEMLDMLDDLHSAASEDSAYEFSGMTRQELLGFLREVIYTAQETMTEIQRQRRAQKPMLRLVNNIEKVG
jgi:hypothetical protein